MSQPEVLAIIKDEWQEREKLRSIFKKKYGEITEKSFNTQLRKLGMFIEGKYENKQYWYRLRQSRDSTVNDY